MRPTPSHTAFTFMTLASSAWLGLAQAQTVVVNPCAGAKALCVGKHAKALLQCHQRAENRGAAVDPACVQKADAKLLACVGKAEAKPPCLTVGDGTALVNGGDAYVQYVVPQLDPSYPTPILNKCSAAKKKAVADTVARRLACLSRAFKRAPGEVDPDCLAEAEAKLAAGIAHAETKTPCLTTGDTAALETGVDTFFADRLAALSASGPGCGNGVNDPGEACDASAPSWGWSACGPGFLCTACNCACPTRYEIALDAAEPESVLDLGWSGIGHRQELSTGNTLTLAVSGCDTAVRPCGTCTLSGPIANRPGTIANRRCTNDTSIHCTSDTPCTGGGGTCEYFFGAWHPRSGGGVGVCIAHQLDGSVGGSVEVETGDLTLSSTIKRRYYNAIQIDRPCPRCLDDPIPNDGVVNGTCDGGPRNGMACDGNATAPSYPDFGVTSLDCPPAPGGFITEVTLPLTSSTDQVVKTVTAASPNCGPAAPGEKCLCQTCNNINQEPCMSNADCPTPPGPVGPICGGNRCIVGSNAGTPCTANSECPAGVCGRPGEPTEPSACIDDTTTVGIFDCTETAPGAGEGECTSGPVDNSCTVASGHAQRGCLDDDDCGGGIGTCESRNRACFLTGSIPGFGNAGTGTLVADGMPDVPVAEVAHPTLAAIGCVGPSGYSPLDNLSGFPGPLRFTQKVTTTALP
jgi:hypothetical protein